MDTATIKKIIDADAGRVSKIFNQRKYMEGKNVAILGRSAHEEPDNRISIPIVRKAVTIVSGYMAGENSISYSTPDAAPKAGIKGAIAKVKQAINGKADYFTGVLQPIFDANDEGLTTHEEFETACAHGLTYEYHYTQDGQARFVEVPPEQCIPLWDDSLPPKLKGMIRYYTVNDGDKDIKKVTTYDQSEIVHYEGESLEKLVETGRESHAYGEVPWAIGKISRHGENLFDHVLSIIDFRDRIVSEDYANEAQRFSNSYLLMKNRLDTELDETGLSEVDKLRITRTFEGLDDDVTKAVSFLVKDIPIAFVKNADELFERLSYDMMMLFDNKDIATTGQISGISLAYKLLPFEYASATYEAYFSRFLQWRIRLIQNVTGNLKANMQDRPQVSIRFTRNLPFDLQSAVDMFGKVAGASLPIRTALKLLPTSLVPDIEEVAQEMERSQAIPDMDTPADEPGTEPDA